MSEIELGGMNISEMISNEALLFDRMVTYIDKAYPIEYCPFCGQKLEEPTDSLARDNLNVRR